MNSRLVSQSFLGSDSDQLLHRCRVAIIGLGGGGSHVAQQLSHVGIGNFVLFDPDHVEYKNLNRMVGATVKDARLKNLKTKTIRRAIKRVNPDARIVAVPKKWQDEAEHLRDCDAIFGCVDSFSERKQIEVLARRYLIPYLDIGMDVHAVDDGFSVGGQALLSMPGELCMSCFGIVREEVLSREAAEYGAAGPQPQVVWANGVLASIAVGIFVQLLCPWRKQRVQGILREYDGESHTVTASNKLAYLRDRKCPHFADAQDLGDPFWSA
jgi:molybdopterin-synthase adenylyltransferase